MEVPGGVRDDGAGDGERAPESAAEANDAAKPRLPREGRRKKKPVILRESLAPRAGAALQQG
jgi:hypothetical protein